MMGGIKPWHHLFVVLLNAAFSARSVIGFTLVTTNHIALGGKLSRSPRLVAQSKHRPEDDQDDDDDDEWIAAEISEVITSGIDEKEEEEWMTDQEKAKRKRENAQAYQAAFSRYQQEISRKPVGNPEQKKDETSRASPYTEEEEEVIRAMGGKTKNSPSKREPGFLGDSTLQEIATDYSVPVCYLADVLCMWGVPVPINVHDRLGDLVTGEQAFAILEAVNSLDVAALHDRYSNQSLLDLCNYWNIDLSEGFEMAMKEGWSLPFGVHTVLRVEQEEELLRVLGGVNTYE